MERSLKNRIKSLRVKANPPNSLKTKDRQGNLVFRLRWQRQNHAFDVMLQLRVQILQRRQIYYQPNMENI